MELILALATGVTVGAAVLVAFGVPDRRIGPGRDRGRAAGRGPAGDSVRPAEVETKGSRKFAAVAADGRRLFVKALGSDQRDADLLYRAYRAVRLRNVGDTRPAASLFHAVEHQALVGVMAERAGVSAPGVDRVVRAGDTALLVMEWVDGCSLDRLPAGQIGDDLLARLWAEVDKLHRAGIAHRSLRAANVMVSPAGQPRIVDFGFSELAATPAADGPGRGRTARLAGRPGRRGPGRCRRRRGARRPGGGAGRCRCCSRWPCPPPPAARSRGTTACSPGPGPRPPPPAARRRRTWPACSGCGRGPCSPSPCGRSVLLPAARAGQGREQLARPAVGALDLAARHHRLLGADLPGQRHLAARQRDGPAAVLAHGADPGRLLVRQPGVARPTSAAWP